MVDPVTAAAVLKAANDITTVTEKLGLLEILKGKFVKQPDLAAAHLAVILDEFSKIHAALDRELSAYFSLSLYDGMSADEERDARKTLAELEGGTAAVRVAESRGHSTKIRNIYGRFLDPWLQRALDMNENAQMSFVFHSLEDTDNVMIRFMDSLSEYLKERAAETNRLFNLGDRAAAQQSILDAAVEMRFVRKNLVETVVRLRYLQADFISLAGATK